MPLRVWNRQQMWLLPPTLEDLVPTTHPVRFIAAFVEQLDLGELGLTLETAARGGETYDPRMMLAAWLYGFMTRTRATRRLERAACENLPLIWLLGGERPDHTTLARFLGANAEGVKRLFRQTVHTAMDVGLVGFGFQAVDGTRVGAMSRDKMMDRAALQALDHQIDEAIARFFAAVAEESEAAADVVSAEMPEALRSPEGLKERVRVALATVEEREKSRTSHHPGAIDPQTGQPRGPEVHLADPEAVVMKGRHGYVAGYNAQAAVDAQAQVIVAADVIAQATDAQALVPMLAQIRANTGRLAAVTALDGGYHSAANLEAMANAPTELYLADPAMKRQEVRGERAAFHKDAFVYDSATDSYACPLGQTLHFAYLQGGQTQGEDRERVYRCRACGACPQRGLCTTDRQGRRIRVRAEDARLRAHRAKMRTPEARKRMRQRGATVEPVFGIMREHMGLQRFLRRGLDKVRIEWHLLCAAYNLRVLWKAWCRGLQPMAAAA